MRQILFALLTQSGGQHLFWSRADAAAVCAYVATSGMTDRKLASAITQKTVRQYATAGKAWSRECLHAFSRFATGGVPQELCFETLDAEIPKIKQSYATQRALALTIMTTKNPK